MKINKKQVCQADLRQRILTLDIEPGSVLDETVLSRQYELSRTPLREVFQRLAGEGYLTLEENRGAKVSSMDIASMRNFFQSAPLIYAAVGRLAAENALSCQISALKSAQRSFRKAGENSDVFGMAMFNHSFHHIIGEMAGNAYLTPSLSRLLIDHTRMSQLFYNPKTDREEQLIWTACDQHDQMIEAIEKGEPALVVELTLEHWDLSRGRMEKFVRPDPLPTEFDMDLSEGKKNAL
ncbi:MAG: GntR family transcriptional regulator [Anderseniella sp.]|uniref:GntR family transcriptional regulator n=1 Tax=Parasphingorhabdus sp. TaxID=2709688 RepID=UPI003280FFD8